MIKVYALVDPLVGEVRYVGATEHNLKYRLNQHWCKPLNKGLRTWFHELKAKGLKPDIILLEETNNDQVEGRWVQKYANSSLLNETPDGKPCRGPMARFTRHE